MIFVPRGADGRTDRKPWGVRGGTDPTGEWYRCRWKYRRTSGFSKGRWSICGGQVCRVRSTWVTRTRRGGPRRPRRNDVSTNAGNSRPRRRSGGRRAGSVVIVETSEALSGARDHASPGTNRPSRPGSPDPPKGRHRRRRVSPGNSQESSPSLRRSVHGRPAWKRNSKPKKNPSVTSPIIPGVSRGSRNFNRPKTVSVVCSVLHESRNLWCPGFT